MTYRHLLVPTDGSELSSQAVAQAAALAAAVGADLHVLHVLSSFPISLVGVGELVEASTVEALVAASRHQAETILEQAVAVAAAAGVSATAGSRQGSQPHREILAEAEARGCDLIVMASHGRQGLEGLLIGSETQRVLIHSRIPVLVVR